MPMKKHDADVRLILSASIGVYLRLINAFLEIQS